MLYNIISIIKKHTDTLLIATSGYFASITLAQINLLLQCVVLILTIVIMLYREFFKKSKQ